MTSLSFLFFLYDIKQIDSMYVALRLFSNRSRKTSECGRGLPHGNFQI